MAGGIMQLVAYGAQDVYLTNKPEVTFFKIVHRRHTNFAMESIEQTFNGSVDFGRKVSCLVSRNGDLITKCLLEVTLPALTNTGKTVAWTRNIGHVLIDYVTIEIGGQEIDKHYGDWLTIWNELTRTAGHEEGFSVMIGNTAQLTTQAETIPASTVYVPLQFWFCRNPGLALPLVALQYHEVKFSISFRPASQCYITSDGAALTTTPVISNASLFVTYIFLDADERKQMAQAQHEYLVEQLQFNSDESFSNSAYKSKLNFNHPCKEIVWVAQLDSNTLNGANRWSDYTTSGTTSSAFYNGGDSVVDAKLQLNGHDRFATRKGRYFNLVQPFEHHTRCPSTGIYVYSFALNPEDHQPSGSINMSRIDTCNLLLNLSTGTSAGKVRVYAVNYNILRIVAGMGGLAYSN